MSKQLVIFGTGGLARELHQLVRDINAAGKEQYEVLGWLDGDAAKHGQQIHGLPVLGGIEWLEGHSEVEVATGVGAPATRYKLIQQMQQLGHQRFATLVHPTAVIGEEITIGQGSIICANVTTTNDYSIGAHVLINIMATVAHDDVLEDFVTIAPATVLSGNVRVGEGTDVGTNATVIQGIDIGRWSIIGAGAVVTKDIPDNVTAVGMPAKVIKEREEGWHLQ